jgi:hypothetical protein
LRIFFKKINPVLEKRLLTAGVGQFKYTIMDALFSFENGQLQIAMPQLNENEENRRRHFWQKLVLGVQDIEDLVDYKSNDKGLFAVMRIMFPLKSPQVSLLDEF